MFRPNTPHEGITWYYYHRGSCLGDTLSEMPMFDYMWRHEDKHKYVIMTHDFTYDLMVHALAKYAPKITVRRAVPPAELALSPNDRSHRAFMNHSSLNCHEALNPFLVFLSIAPEVSEMSYPRVDFSPFWKPEKFKLPERYMLMPSMFRETLAKQIPTQVIADIATYLEAHGVGLVLSGRRRFHAFDEGSGVDVEIKGNMLPDGHPNIYNITDDADLLETGAILERALAYVGIEGGLMHLAGLTDTPIVAAFTYFAPWNCVPIRHGVMGWKVDEVRPPESLSCRFCVSRMINVASLSNMNCLYDDYKCARDLRLQDFKPHLDRLLARGS